MLAKKLRAAGGGGGSPIEFSLEHTEVKNGLDAQTVTFTSCSLGTADADRYIWVTVAIDFDGTDTYNPLLTIGGVSATQEVEFPISADGKGVAIFKLNVATGTSADIVVDADAGGLKHTAIAVYRLVGASATVDDTFTTSVYTDDISLTPASNDSVVLAVLVSNFDNGTWTYSGLDTDYNPTPNANNTWTHYSATGVTSGAKTYAQSGGGVSNTFVAAVTIPPA